MNNINELKPILQEDDDNIIKNTFKVLYDYTEYSNTDKDFLKKVDNRYFTDPASTKFHGSFQRGLLIHSSNVALLSYQNIKQMREYKVSSYLNSLSVEEFESYLKQTVFVGLFHDYCKVGCYKQEEGVTEKQWNFVNVLLSQVGYDIKARELKGINIDIESFGKSSISNIIQKLEYVKNHIEEYQDEDKLFKTIKSFEKYKKEYEFEDNFKIGHGEKSVILLLRLGVDLTDHQIYAIYNHMNEMDVKWELYQERQRILVHTDMIPMQKAVILAEKQSGFLFECGKEY